MIKKGMTLVEIVVVLAIIMVILSICHIGYRMVQEQRERTFVKELYLDLQNLRQTAILERKKLYFEIVSTQTYRTYEIREATTMTIDKVDLPVSLHFAMDESASQIYFGSTFAQVKAGTLRLKSDNGMDYTITIVPVTGRIHLK